jgi:hypothetical protein
MRTHLGSLLAVFGILIATGRLAAADDADIIKRQKDAVLANWKTVAGEDTPADDETAHTLILGPGTMSLKQLRDAGAAFEARYAQAAKALQMKPNEKLWPGKIAIYLIGDRRQFNTFMRAVAKKRPSVDDSGVFSARGDLPFVAASPPQSKYDPNLEAQAGEQLAGAMLIRRSGEYVPDWIVAGFGRATAWHAAPGAYFSERAQVKRLIRGHNAEDVWTEGKLNVEESPLLRASLVDFLSYGPGAPSFPKFLDGFKPGPNGQARTVVEAFKSIKYDPALLNKAWVNHVAKGR